MRRKLGWIALASFLLCGLTVGCTRPAVQQKQPPDPLLWSKRSVAGKPSDDDKHQSARLDTQDRDPALTVLDDPAPAVPVHLRVTPLLADRADARLLAPQDGGRER
jgi:hypothetical protein